MVETIVPLVERKFCDIAGRRLAYLEAGSGPPIVLLHGNPTSSYLWRNIIPRIASKGRVIAPDLIGHGDSDKLPASEGAARYSFERAFSYLDAMLSELDADTRLTLVLHDWGSALGFHWARLHPDRVRGLVYMESIVAPWASWADWPEKARGIFQGFRSPNGEELILRRNLFIERVLPGSVLRELSIEELWHYYAPFVIEADRQTMLNWPRLLPIAGEPSHMVAVVQLYADWLRQSQVPKLFINAEPGSILVGAQREFCRSWPNQTEVTVKGLHFIQEDSPDEIGHAVAGWLSALE
jgi:haloalkane dehalogenase